jgi:hypothetical protein
MLPTVCQLCNAEYIYAAKSLRVHLVCCQRCDNCVTQGSFMLPMVCQLCNTEFNYAANDVPIAYCRICLCWQRCANCVTQSTFILPKVCVSTLFAANGVIIV